MRHVNQPRLIRRRGVLAGIAGFSAAVLAAPHVARAAVKVARFGHNNADNSHFGRGGYALAEAVAADPVLSGVLKIEIYGNAQLGDDVSMLKSCVNGTLDGMLIGSSIMANVVPEIGAINAPYLFRDVAQTRAVLDGPIGVDLMALSRAKGLPVLAWGENGLRHVTSNKPVRTLAEMHGLKIRVPQSEMILGGFRALGADPKPLAFGLVRDALRTGEFDAQENPITTIETAKLNEVQKYLCLTGHIYDGIGVIASADMLEDLTEPQRAALTVCGQKAAAMTRQVSEAAAKDGVARLKAAGMVVIDDVDVAGLKLACQPFLEGLSKTYGEARMKNLLTAGA